MKVWAYTVVRNEALLMPFWLRHYRAFCDQMIVYDDQSDDGTAEIVARSGAVLRDYPESGFDDMAMVALANQTYREARGKADWIIWVDADEFLYHPQILERLTALKALNVNMPMVEGYCMLADHTPMGRGQLTDLIRTGVRAPRYDKPCIVDPNIDLEWEVGKHAAMVQGDRRANTSDPLKLLHYRWFGRTYCEERSARNYARLSDRNRASQFGIETFPGFTGPYSPSWYEAQMPLVRDVVSEMVTA